MTHGLKALSHRLHGPSRSSPSFDHKCQDGLASSMHDQKIGRNKKAGWPCRLSKCKTRSRKDVTCADLLVSGGSLCLDALGGRQLIGSCSSSCVHGWRSCIRSLAFAQICPCLLHITLSNEPKEEETRQTLQLSAEI